MNSENENRNNIKALFFDFDGVIANINLGKVLKESKCFLQYFKIPIENVISGYFYNNPENVSLDLGLTTVDKVRNEMRTKLWSGSTALWVAWWRMLENSYEMEPLMSSWLDQLSRIYTIVMITDNHLGFNEWLIERPDISKYFKVIVNSATYGIKKPDKRLFKKATERIAVDFSEIIYIDDDISNIRYAEHHGIKSVLFTSESNIRRKLNYFLI